MIVLHSLPSYVFHVFYFPYSPSPCPEHTGTHGCTTMGSWDSERLDSRSLDPTTLRVQSTRTLDPSIHRGHQSPLGPAGNAQHAWEFWENLYSYSRARGGLDRDRDRDGRYRYPPSPYYRSLGLGVAVSVPVHRFPLCHFFLPVSHPRQLSTFHYGCALAL